MTLTKVPRDDRLTWVLTDELLVRGTIILYYIISHVTTIISDEICSVGNFWLNNKNN